MAVKNPFSASNLANSTHGNCLLQIPSLSASHCLSFYLTMPLGHHFEALPQIPPLTFSEGGFCHPFSVLFSPHGCSTPHSSLSARFGVSFSSSDLVWESSPLPTQHLDLKNGDSCLPFSCSNLTPGRSRPSTFDLSLFPKGFCHRFVCETFSPAIASLNLKNGHFRHRTGSFNVTTGCTSPTLSV